jgi:hypothetical protein
MSLKPVLWYWALFFVPFVAQSQFTEKTPSSFKKQVELELGYAPVGTTFSPASYNGGFGVGLSYRFKPKHALLLSATGSLTTQDVEPHIFETYKFRYSYKWMHYLFGIGYRYHYFQHKRFDLSTSIIGGINIISNDETTFWFTPKPVQAPADTNSYFNTLNLNYRYGKSINGLISTEASWRMRKRIKLRAVVAYSYNTASLSVMNYVRDNQSNIYTYPGRSERHNCMLMLGIGIKLFERSQPLYE